MTKPLDPDIKALRAVSQAFSMRLDKGHWFGVSAMRYPRLKTKSLKGPRVWQIMLRFGRKASL